MSTLIESGARAIKNLIPGISFDPRAREMQAARGRELIKNLALGGLAVGGTAGAAVVLSNYLKSLGQEAELNDESRLNDDTLYLAMPEKRAADGDGPRWSAPGLAVTGGVLSAGAAYALTQAIYNMIQKKRQMKLLDEAQAETLAAADAELSKGAALGMTLPELVAAFPVALPLLAAIASGGITYNALNKAFPTVTSPKSKYPKRIRAVANDGSISEIDNDGKTENLDNVTKSATDRAGEQDCELAGLEFMTLLTMQLAHEKKAAHCVTADIVKAAARDGIKAIAVAYETGGVVGLSEVVKSAADVDEVAKVAAVVALHRHHNLAPVISSIAAAEYRELMPGIMQKCASMDEVMLDKVAGLASLMQLTFFRPLLLKSAGIPAGLMAELSSILSGDIPEEVQRGTRSQEEEQRDEALTSDSSGSMAEENEGGRNGEEGSDEESQGKDDAVDTFFDTPGAAPPPRS